MIEVKGLTKRYGHHWAIRDLDFEVQQGDVLGFLGPNGAGKTTTMRILTCYFPPTEGTARIAGFDVFDQSLEVRRRVGYLPENPPLYTEMSVRGYLRFAAKVRDVPGRDVTRRVDAVIAQCRLDKVKDRLISQLSKGYRQRVGLAQALIHEPPVLILDEPTSGLDPAQIIEFRQLIRGLAERHTVILSTHILHEVSQICHRVIMINDGKIVAQGTPEHLVQSLATQPKLAIQIRGDAETARHRISGVPGVLDVHTEAQRADGATLIVDFDSNTDPREEIARALVSANLGLQELATRGVSLEEIYLQLISGGTAGIGASPAVEMTTDAEPAGAREDNA